MEQFMMPAWAMIPFGLMLLAIAICPILVGKWWENNRNKLLLSVVLALPVVIYMAMNGLKTNLVDTVAYDYIPFIVLLLSLFVITGGIHLQGDIVAKPIVNTAFLATGFVLASLMGTTGAAMLLIRPLLETNQQREHKIHTVLFFIALVANCGGLMTPLGDPPLFMMYMRGAHFGWFANMWQEWLFTGAVLLGIYCLLDNYYYRREHWTSLSADVREKQPLRLLGKINLLYLLGVVACVAFVNADTIKIMNSDNLFFRSLREICLLVLTGLSLLTTSKKVRYEQNKYSWAPILEVAALFFGIFITMAPALLYLQQNASGLGLTDVWQFYYATGLLSSFLDNTPTAVAFWSMGTGLDSAILSNMIADGGSLTMLSEGVRMQYPTVLLKAICTSAVFFGSMTYIGNGPNFMVKSIAEENGINMPSFFGYIFKFSLIVLLPVYILIQLIFL